MRRDDIRNIAIIAHVDHGKTTLVDALLRQSGQFRDSQLAKSCILDSNDLERERGITILSKNIALEHEGVRINIIDTPGHADFGGEVERVLRMADGALILVDAFEGPRPQTRFVVQKALEVGLAPIVVINKIDRPDARPSAVLDEVFELFIELGADDATLDFPYLFASGRDGFASGDPEARNGTIAPLLNLVRDHVPGPDVDPSGPFQMMVTTIDWSEYVGRLATGRIAAGTIHKGQKVSLLKEGKAIAGDVANVEKFEKLGRVAVEQAAAGDVVAITGIADVEIGDTIAASETVPALPRLAIDEPTLSMLMTINSSPFAGRDGKYVTSRNLRERLFRELESNLALGVSETDQAESFLVSGRGVLHLAILIETMRREGYELSVAKPEVIFKRIDGKRQEPFEALTIDVPAEHVGGVMELVGGRRGQVLDMNAASANGGLGGMTHLEFSIPARGLIGLRTKLLGASRGEAIIHHRFAGYQPAGGDVPTRQRGVLVSQVRGKAVAYALGKLQERAEMFIAPGAEVYEGMIIGEHARDNDLVVNPVREKKLTNMRAAGSDENVLLAPPREMSLEAALEYIADDELVEVTPNAIRLRKMFLTENERKRRQRQALAG